MSARELRRVEVLSRVKAGTLSVKSAAALLASGLIGLVDLSERITGLRMGARP